MNAADAVVGFYKDKIPSRKSPLTRTYDHVTNLNKGIGDTMSISHLPKAAFAQGKEVFIWSESSYFGELMLFNPYAKAMQRDEAYMRAEILEEQYDCGNGHFFQRLQRACGLIPDLKPKGVIEIKKRPLEEKIVLHLSVGAHAAVQRHRGIHPRAREFYPEHRTTLQKFINNSSFRFVEIGTEFSGLENVENRCGLRLSESIRELSSAQFFIGLHSGVMHLAAALDVKSIIIINFPQELYLPALKDLLITDLHWLYPQNVHLEEDIDATLTPIFSYANLEKAINGDIYPFWRDDYLELIWQFAPP